MKKVLLALCAVIALGASAETYKLGEAFAYGFNPEFKWFNGDNRYAEDGGTYEAVLNVNWPAFAMDESADLATNTGLGMIWFMNKRFATYEAAGEYAPVVEDPWNRDSYAIKVQASTWDGFGNLMFALPKMNELCRIRSIFRVKTDDGECTWNNPNKPLWVRLTETDQDECIPTVTYCEENIKFWEEPGYRVVDQYYQPNGQTYFSITFDAGGLTCQRNVGFYLEEVSCVPVSKIAGDTHTEEGVSYEIVAERPDLTVISESSQYIPNLGTPVTKLEVGKSYIFKNARSSDPETDYYYSDYQYLGDIAIEDRLECCTDPNNRCIWIAEQGSTESSIYLKNAVTGGYLFSNYEENPYYMTSSTYPIDIYVFNDDYFVPDSYYHPYGGDYYEGTIGLSIAENEPSHEFNFLNAIGGQESPYLCSYAFDKGSQWYAFEVPTLESKPLVGLEFYESNVICPLGDSVKLKVYKTPSNAEGEISFTSANPEVATVDSKGVVTGIAEGETEIIAICGSLTATCVVTVKGSDIIEPELGTPVTKVEVGKSYVFKNARYSDYKSNQYEYGYRYLWDMELGSKLKCSKDLDENCVWIVEQGSTESSIYLRNAVTGGYLFTNFEDDDFYMASSTYPIDIYVFDGKNYPYGIYDYEGSIGLSTAGYSTEKTFVNAAGDSRVPYICTYTFDRGSQWYAYEVSASESEPLVGIEFTEDNVICPLGDIVKLRVKKIPFNAEGEISFTSSNPEVATVDSKGVVTGIAEGETEITAVSGTFTATCIITVERQVVPVDWVEFNGIIGNVGESIAISTSIWPDNATDATINWYSSDPEVAAVDQAGVVWFNAAGTAYIYAECQNSFNQFYLPFIVKEVMAQALNVFPVEAIGGIGHEFSLLALHEPENTTDKSVTWESSDPEVAMVSEDGRVTLAAIGIAQITARSGEHTATCTVTVDNDIVSLTEMAATGVVIDIVEGGIIVRNAAEGESIAVYTVDGKVVNGAIAESKETHLKLAAGIYIVKVSPTTVAKVLIK